MATALPLQALELLVVLVDTRPNRKGTGQQRDPGQIKKHVKRIATHIDGIRTRLSPPSTGDVEATISAT